MPARSGRRVAGEEDVKGLLLGGGPDLKLITVDCLDELFEDRGFDCLRESFLRRLPNIEMVVPESRRWMLGSEEREMEGPSEGELWSTESTETDMTVM